MTQKIPPPYENSIYEEKNRGNNTILVFNHLYEDKQYFNNNQLLKFLKFNLIVSD